MPTPRDEEAVESGVTPMFALDIAAPLRGAFPSCPPEEGRGEQQHIAPLSGEGEHAAEEAPRGGVGNEVAGESQGGNGEERDASSERKREDEGEQHISDHVATNGGMPEQSPSPAPSLPSSERDSDARLAQSMATASISSLDAAEAKTPSARYLHFPELDRDRVCIL